MLPLSNTAVPAGYLLRCYALLIEDTPLLVDGLTMEWLDQYGSGLNEKSGTKITVLSDGRRQLNIGIGSRGGGDQIKFW